MRREVVGRGNNTVPNPAPSASASPSANAATYIDNINSRLNNVGVKVANTAKLSGSAAWIENAITEGHAPELAAIFKKLGKNVKSTKELKTLLADYPEVTTATDYITGARKLAEMIIPGTGSSGNNMPTQTITQYSDDYLKKVADGIGQDFLDRKLSSAEVEKIMPKLRELVNKGTTTTSKVVGGKNVVSTTPGFTTADAEKVVQTELRLGASKDLERKQYLDFADFMSKNMAGM